MKISVGALLASALGLVLAVPVAALAVTDLLAAELLRQTEQELLAEVNLAGEVYRALVVGGGGAPAGEGERWFPIEPAIDPRTTPLFEPAERRGPATTPTAAVALSAILERARVRNLSGLRVLDRRGQVVASSTGEVGYALDHLPEVQAALAGGYAPALRERVSASPAPEVGSISRGARVRVSLAVPIFADPRRPLGAGGEVLGAVYASRTPVEVSAWLWRRRGELLGVALVTLGSVGLALLLLWRSIASPLAKLRAAAERVEAGEVDTRLVAPGPAPAELAALAEALERMRGELVARASYIREMAAAMVHELKTPLTSIRGAAELLGGGLPPDRAARLLGHIEADAIRMDGLVRRLLELARIEASPAARVAVDLVPLARAQAEAAEARLTAPESLVAAVDPAGIELLLGNLLDNARRYGAGAPIEVHLRAVDGHVELEVRDHGPPQAPGHFDRVFERFYTTDRERGGTGLGLAIVKAVVEAHGGTVRAIAHPDGASFVARWPATSG